MSRSILALAALLVLWPASAMAEPCSRAQGLAAGAVAPCSGVLWPAAWTAEALRDRKVRIPMMRAQARRDAAMAAAALEAAEAAARHAAEVAAAELEAERARSSTWRQLAEARGEQLGTIVAAPPPPPPPWYASTWAKVGGGLLVGAAAAVGAEELYRRLSR